MSNLLWKSLLASPAVVGAALAMSGAAMATEAQSNEIVVSEISVLESELSVLEEVAPVAEPIELAVVTEAQPSEVVASELSVLEEVAPVAGPIELAQVTSVSELSDVRPTDWAFTALQRLVEQYQCIEGYPNQTFRGNQAMTRFEFAAGLNACLDRILEIVGTFPTDELDAIRQLQQQFQAELAQLRGRVDALEADVAELEANQFSTTTKLRGQVDSNLVVPFDVLGATDTSTTFDNRARLNFDTSFTGEDLLRIRLQAGNNNGSLGGATGIAGFGPANAAGGDFNIGINDFFYLFPVGNRLDIIVAANSIAGDDYVVSTIVPFDGPSVLDAGGPLFYDVFAGGDSGAGFSFALSENFVFDAGYSFGATGATGGSNPSTGIFAAGDQSYIAQLSYISDGFLDIAFTYLHGSASDALGNVTEADTFAVPVNFDFGGFMVGGYFAYHDFETSGTAVAVDDDTSWMVGFAVPNVFGAGNEFGVYGGVSPSTLATEPLYIEGYLSIAVNEFLTLTPAVVYLDTDSGAADDTGLFGAIRATFNF
ncbi:MAG: iron uptake porin [Cyanobacteria bacterium P01_D01_bin.128]